MDNDRASPSQRKRKNHSFLMVQMQDFSPPVEIPPEFYKVFGKEEPKKAILETDYGKSEVEVEKHQNRFCFSKGWSKFVKENKLESGDSLGFEYLSECSKFEVKIYGKGGCEKEHYYPSETGKNEDERDGQKRKREEEKEQDNNVKKDGTFKARKRIRDSYPDSVFWSNLLGDEGSEVEPINLDSCSSHPIVEEEIGNVKKDGTFKAAKWILDSDPDSVFSNKILGDEGSEAEPINLDSCSSHPIVEEEIGNSKQPSSEEKENGEPKSLHSDNLTDFKPEGPHFQVELKSSHIIGHQLNIPAPFSRQYIKESRQSQNIKVGMPNKELRELGVVGVWGEYHNKNEMVRAKLTRGWMNLVKEYRLQEKDICIFELIQQTHELVFHLHVFRRDPQNQFILIP